MSVLVLLLTPLLTVQPTIVKAQSNNQAPAIAWQQTYGAFFNGTGVQAVTNMVQSVAAVSNLIQTSDGGYVFMDEGWGSYGNFAPSIVFKVDSSGNINWTKAINNILGLAIKQTSDRGWKFQDIGIILLMNIILSKWTLKETLNLLKAIQTFRI